jgi:hypothetical protein
MIVRMGEPDDIPALQAIEKKARTVYAHSQALNSWQRARRSRPIALSREPPLSQRYQRRLRVLPLSSRWTRHCIWPISPFFQTRQIAELGLTSSKV